MKKTAKIRCPLCETGEIEVQVQIPKEKIKKAIVELRKQGLTLQDIAKTLGLSSAGHVKFFD